MNQINSSDALDHLLIPVVVIYWMMNEGMPLVY